jgi:ABC-type bacteriocin/lantibiotic exporter with double-glycine peptidase domain
MQTNREPPRLPSRGNVAARAQGVIVKIVAVVGAAVVLMSAIAVSLVLFAVAIAFLVGFGGYLWWKTRHVRKQMRAHFEREHEHEREQGDVIEGVVAREVRVRQIDDSRR